MKEEKIIAYLNNESDPRDRGEVENWINDSEENRKSFNQLKTIWENSASDLSDLQIDQEEAWKKIRVSIGQGSITRKNSHTISFRSFSKIAAVVIILVGIGFLASKIGGKLNTIEKEPIRFETAMELRDVILPDGSHVWLNRNSAIIYPSKFTGGTREIEISGEAYFEVEKKWRKPFIVHSDGTYIEVLGTSFNVETANDPAETLVTVVTGKVALYTRSGNADRIVLDPGEVGLSIPDSSLLTKAQNKNRNFLAWKTGVLVFSYTPLKEVCNVLSKQFDTKILPENEEIASNRYLTATYDNKDVGEILDILAITLGISYRTDKNSVILMEK